MESMNINELMRPVEEFPRISNQASFMEAVEALERVDEEVRRGKAPERILLVYDESSGKIVGKLSPIDVVKALEPDYLDFEHIDTGSYSRMFQASLESMKKRNVASVIHTVLHGSTQTYTVAHGPSHG